ncbi:MAG: PHP domain-containing protein [Spirochaetales bacterium]|nr:PHP domain-containing protein [Spirochaetales bacterium]
MAREAKEFYSDLNIPEIEKRLKAADEVGKLIRSGELKNIDSGGEVNNHVHTIYSFSPYSPSLAAFKAWEAGLCAVGIMDHDSVSGAREMFSAGKSIGIATTTGFEVRVNMSGTLVEGRKINNPDSSNIAYMAVHGIPSSQLDAAEDFLKPIHEERNKRNRLQTDALNKIISEKGLPELDFDNDIVPLSKSKDGGSITERHILYAFAKLIVDTAGKGECVIDFLENKLDLKLPEKVIGFLSDTENPHYLYDLLGVLKSAFLPSFFIQPNEKECVSVKKVVYFARSIGAIPAYAYLGDVSESPTGDKKAEKFEDDYLDELISEIKNIGFYAVTYMPPRNTKKQLSRLTKLCQKNGLMEISGVDINSSRQSFNCREVMDPDFSQLIDATWALIAHERLASKDLKYSLFSEDNPWAKESLEQRIKRYAESGRKMDPFNPEKIKIGENS